jgi:hypothetical protein
MLGQFKTYKVRLHVMPLLAKLGQVRSCLVRLGHVRPL